MVYSHDTGSYDCSGDEGAGATCRYLLLNTASGWEVVHVVETPEEGGSLAASLVLVRPEKARSLEPPRGGWSFTVQGKYGLQRYNDSTIEVAPLESGSIESANHPLPSASPCRQVTCCILRRLRVGRLGGGGGVQQAVRGRLHNPHQEGHLRPQL